MNLFQSYIASSEGCLSAAVLYLSPKPAEQVCVPVLCQVQVTAERCPVVVVGREGKGVLMGATIANGERETERFEKGKSVSLCSIDDVTVVADCYNRITGAVPITNSLSVTDPVQIVVILM